MIMAINNAKHIIGEIDGIRCTIIESGTTLERAAFLRQLLEYNDLEVKELIVPPDTEGGEQKYTIGVTDLIFNPVFVIYERKLKTPEGGIITPGYWRQECTDCDPMYFLRRKEPTPASSGRSFTSTHITY
jgi:hypothetical protein